jgi:lupus La protein
MAVEEIVPEVIVAPTKTETETPIVRPEVVTDTGLEAKIIRQVEYYFGDLNLTKDKFMQEEIQKDEGWVSVETLVKFNRLKQLSADHTIILTCLKRSTNDLLEVDEEKQRVRRTKALPENPSEFETTLKQNTLYVKGFPEKMSLDDLQTWFEQYGKVLQVFMRRYPATKQFKGSVFVTFDNSEQVKKFMDLESVKYEETVLERESQDAYLTRKAPSLARAKEEREKREADKEAKKKDRDEAEKAFYESQRVSGSVLHLKGLPAEGTRENLKELFDNYAKVKWVDYSKGEPEAFLRFVEADKAAPALEQLKAASEGKVVLMGAELEVRVVEGEEEEKFWKSTIEKLVEAKKAKSSRSRGFGGRGGNNSGRGDWKKNQNRVGKRDNENAGGDNRDNKRVKASE